MKKEKKALVLCGGGTKGAYELGVIEALRALKQDQFDYILGTSVGALNAMFLVQHDYQNMKYMYEHLTMDQIIGSFIPSDLSITQMWNKSSDIKQTIQTYMSEKGVNVEPLKQMIDQYFDEKKFFGSKIDFGCMVAKNKTHQAVYVDKQMMKENGRQWLLASASAYPVFPVTEIDGQEYIDGGYSDNLPIAFAIERGATKIVAIDLNRQLTHPMYYRRHKITYIHPFVDLPSFLNFDPDLMQRSRKLGYYDGLKAYGYYQGRKYTFYPFHHPKYADDIQWSIMQIEHEIAQDTIGSKVHRELYLTNQIKEKYGIPYVLEEDYFFGIVEEIMDLLEFDLYQVYRWKDVEKRIVQAYRHAALQDYAYLPSGIKDLVDYAKSLGTKGMVEKMVHTHFFPEHAILNDSIKNTIYPMAKMMAKTIYEMMKGQ